MKCISLIPILMSILSIQAFAKDNMTDKMSKATFMEAKDIKWEAVAEFPGVHMATVEGDPMKWHHAFMKFDAGFSAPMHHHTSDHFVTVVAGTLILTVDGQEHRLPPGSFFSFKKKQAHSTSCAAGAECIISADVRGKWDVVPQKKLVTRD